MTHLKKKKKIAVFGGTFDPPHKGHFNLATRIIDDSFAEQVLFVPAFLPPHKLNVDSSSFLHRKNMLDVSLNTMGNSKFSSTDIEYRRRPNASYTFDTLLDLSKENPDNQYILLIGADNLLTFHSWYRASELVGNWGILAYPRRGYEDLALISKYWDAQTAAKLIATLLPYPFFDISSTEIRKFIAEKKAKHPQILQETFEYIKEHNLYGINEC